MWRSNSSLIRTNTMFYDLNKVYILIFARKCFIARTFSLHVRMKFPGKLCMKEYIKRM